jgi:hypothetical protein
MIIIVAIIKYRLEPRRLLAECRIPRCCWLLHCLRRWLLAAAGSLFSAWLLLAIFR